MGERLAEQRARPPERRLTRPALSYATPPSVATPINSVCCRIRMKAAGTT